MIFYLADFNGGEVSGGIRTLYRHVETLTRHGIDATIISPSGRPSWFQSDAPLLTVVPEHVDPRDHAVFPEAFRPETPVFAFFLQKQVTKHIFCQNHYYVFQAADACARPDHFGIDRVFACSIESAGFLTRAFGYGPVPVVPYAIDPGLFHPGRKDFSIAYMPRKQEAYAHFVRKLFDARHPDLGCVEWVAIDGCSEAETAEVLRRCAVFLSLSHFEGFGLPPLEAMASGCLVAGLHGGGGREYACASNGLWFEAEAPLDCVNGLATLLRGLQQDAPFTHEMRRQGILTAARYSPDRMAAALLSYFSTV